MEEKLIYEVIRIINGKPLFLESHLDRMKNSFKLINEEFPLTYENIKDQIEEIIKKENKFYGNIKLIYGIFSKKLDIFFIEHSYPTEDMYKNGVDVVLYFGERDNPNAKIVNNEFRSKVNEKIKENNAYEAILIDRNGYITEGSRSNIFMIKGNNLLTSPTKAVLPGVTRNEILKVAQKLNINIKEVEYNYSKINELDGMFISGTSPKVLPIKKVENINMDPNNKIIRRIIDGYNLETDLYLKKH